MVAPWQISFATSSDGGQVGFRMNCFADRDRLVAELKFHNSIGDLPARAENQLLAPLLDQAKLHAAKAREKQAIKESESALQVARQALTDLQTRMTELEKRSQDSALWKAKDAAQQLADIETQRTALQKQSQFQGDVIKHWQGEVSSARQHHLLAVEGKVKELLDQASADVTAKRKELLSKLAEKLGQELDRLCEVEQALALLVAHRDALTAKVVAVLNS